MFRLLRVLAVIVPLVKCLSVGRPPMSVRQLLEANREAWAEAR